MLSTGQAVVISYSQQKIIVIFSNQTVQALDSHANLHHCEYTGSRMQSDEYVGGMWQ